MGDPHLKVMTLDVLDDAFGTLEKRAQVVGEIGMADKDVQSRRRAPELPQRSRISHSRQK